ncbi:AtpZ/AtpI family protein [Sphingomonas azotifigens]|uniref:AtpZ/AtpI family protein n=1 Tax=Sphingomonas azotifigens TaxID=330920 RepID=UPI003F75BF87
MLALSDDPIRSDLDRRIADAKAAVREGQTPVRKPEKGYKQGSRVLAELIGAPLGGGVIGFALDRWLGTTPWAFLIVLALSVVVAFRNIYKISKERAE